MENHSNQKIPMGLLPEIQKSVRAKTLAWIEPIPFQDKKFPPFLLVGLTVGSTLVMKKAREKIISIVPYSLTPADLTFCHFEVLKRDSLFNFLHLSDERLMLSPGMCFPFQTSSKSLLESRFLESKLVFQGFAKKATSFFQSGMHLLELKDFTTAAFLFHQAIELGLRAAEVFAIGKGTKSHRLERHILAAQSYSPALAEIFLDEHHNSISAIAILEESYLGSRYTYSFSVSEDDLTGIPELIKAFFNRLFQLPTSYEIAMNEFTSTHTS